jgi:5-carboxymethyl-2-hydroxymuconate isomerase
MPHLTLEYTNNLPALDVKQALLKLNQALLASGQFEEIDIKSRAIRLDDFLVGTSSGGRAFIHLRLSILSGRSLQVQQALSASLLHAMRECCADLHVGHLQLSVEVLEIDRKIYSKQMFIR